MLLLDFIVSLPDKPPTVSIRATLQLGRAGRGSRSDKRCIFGYHGVFTFRCIKFVPCGTSNGRLAGVFPWEWYQYSSFVDS